MHILEDMKSSIVSNTPFFNHKSNNMELIVDASSHRLGAHLVSEGKVTAYTSRWLSKTEQKYSQLEKELYAIAFGCKHFHHYLYGWHVEVTTDHRPLKMVVANPIHKAPPRVQRLMLQLQPYDLSLKFQPGSEIPVADALSRLHLGDADPTLEESLDVYVHQLFMALLGGSKCLVRSVYASLQRHQVLKLGGSNREGATVSGFDRSADSYQSKSQKKKKKKLYAEVIEVTDGSARNRKKKLKKANATSILGNQMNENATPEELLQEIDQGRAPLPAHLEELEEVLEFESRESVKEESTDFK
ncbi:hypothetical protein QYM36_012439 [Artemia franciscana]|uniref:Reverse transcriptase RNase H-like domain-containing protein n=1 Tax=Artemia franciscana TaxID=6661 RepID=A0AA88L7T8_ARTSF|nr:hypothetical protein QYM36_012439 [Artemia franciscana]